MKILKEVKGGDVLWLFHQVLLTWLGCGLAVDVNAEEEPMGTTTCGATSNWFLAIEEETEEGAGKLITSTATARTRSLIVKSFVLTAM